MALMDVAASPPKAARIACTPELEQIQARHAHKLELVVNTHTPVGAHICHLKWERIRKPKAATPCTPVPSCKPL